MKVKIPFIFTCIFDLEEMMENVREPSEYILRNGLFPIFVQDGSCRTERTRSFAC